MATLPPVFEDEAAGGCGASVSGASDRVNMADHQVNGSQAGNHMNGFPNVSGPFFIGVAGGTASGKSTVCQKIKEQLRANGSEQHKQVVVVSMEDFYRPLTDAEQERARKGLYNFDHPGAFDDDLILSTLMDLKAGRTVRIPSYDSINCCRQDEWKLVQAADVIVFEGLLSFYFKDIRNIFNMKIFVDTDADTRLSRRVIRDMKERGRDLDKILHQYTYFIKPAFEEFCLPTKKHADIIIPRGADNLVAINLIVQTVQDLLQRPQKFQRACRLRHNSDSLMHFRYSPPH